jgi:hypothetical protein
LHKGHLSLCFFPGALFLGGLWVARRIQSHFILHGILVGIVGVVLFRFLLPLVTPLTQQLPPEGAEPNIAGFMLFFIPAIMKILASTTGAYVGGRRRTKAV